MRGAARLGIAVLVVWVSGGSAQAGQTTFTLDSVASQLLVCEQDGILGYIPRAFLSGKVTIDFQGSPAIPADGQAPIAVPEIDITGTPDLGQLLNVIVIESLGIESPFAGAFSTGYVQGVPAGTDNLVVDRFNFALDGALRVNLGPPLILPLSEVFQESDAGASAVDLVAAITKLGSAADCDLAGACTIRNDGPGAIPPVNQACDPDTFCLPGELCEDIVLENSPLGGTTVFKMKIVIAASSAATPPSCSPPGM